MRFNGRHYRGYSRYVRATKRLEAEVRNALTPPVRRRSARRNTRRK